MATSGRADTDETILSHLEGYRGSRPVRIGNDAVRQRQIDVCGELMDSVYLYNREVPISYDLWVGLSKRLDWLSRHWEEPDEGIWEIRGPRQRFTYSALMTWVAYDRAARLARDRGLPGPVERWRKLAASAHRYRSAGRARSSSGAAIPTAPGATDDAESIADSALDPIGVTFSGVP